MQKGDFFMLARECLSEFKAECELRRMSKRTIKGNNTVESCQMMQKDRSHFSGAVLVVRFVLHVVEGKTDHLVYQFIAADLI